MLQKSFQTERLYLRLLETSDAVEMTRVLQNPNVTTKVAILPFPYEESDAHAWIQKADQAFQDETDLLLGIFLKDSMRFVGNVSLHFEADSSRTEIGYWLDESVWGKGYASEFAQALLTYAFEDLKLHSVFATVALDNVASQQLLEKMGFTRNSTKDVLTVSGTMRPSYFYELFQDAFMESQTKEKVELNLCHNSPKKPPSSTPMPTTYSHGMKAPKPSDAYSRRGSL
jgi:RimJ/RimL family protein N-acetyltransferase